MIRKSFLQALFFLFFYPSFCDQWLHQPRVVVLHFRGILQAGQCCSPGALLGDVLLLIITLHHSPSGYHWIIIIAFFSSVGLTQSFSPGDFSVGSSVGRGSLVPWWAQSTGGNAVQWSSAVFFLFSIDCGPALSCWMLILTPASTDIPIQCCYHWLWSQKSCLHNADSLGFWTCSCSCP